jgi:hypothetical protein
VVVLFNYFSWDSPPVVYMNLAWRDSRSVECIRCWRLLNFGTFRHRYFFICQHVGCNAKRINFRL